MRRPGALSIASKQRSDRDTDRYAICYRNAIEFPKLFSIERPLNRINAFNSHLPQSTPQNHNAGEFRIGIIYFYTHPTQIYQPILHTGIDGSYLIQNLEYTQNNSNLKIKCIKTTSSLHGQFNIFKIV